MSSPATPASEWGNKLKYGDYEVVLNAEGRPVELGKGGFGKTLRALRRDRAFGKELTREFAIKVLRPSLLTSQSKRLQFIEELSALSELKDANLVQYFGCGEAEGEVFYVMEFCRGGDLSRLVQNLGPLERDVASVVRIGLQVCSGLRVMHRRRYVHRDIKPSNILLAEDVMPTFEWLAEALELNHALCKIVDFGLVQDTSSEAEGAGNSRFAGSPMFASPEQIREQPVDARSDIYSLGMTLWYLAQGAGPLLDSSGREIRDVREAMKLHLDSERHEWRFPAQWPAIFSSVLARMVEKEVDKRFKSVREAEKALEACLEQLSPNASATATSSYLGGLPEFKVRDLGGPLDRVYRLVSLHQKKRSLCKVFNATRQDSTDPLTLTLIENSVLRPGGVVDVDKETALRDYLMQVWAATTHPAAPRVIQRVEEVVVSDDGLAVVEQSPESVPLSSVLRARGRMPFGEIAGRILLPVAEALDFLKQQGVEQVSLTPDDVVLGGAIAAAASDSAALRKPLSEWPSLLPQLSAVRVPAKFLPDLLVGTSLAHSTLVGSIHLDEDAPFSMTSTFCRLLYRLIDGSDLPTAAEFDENAFTETTALRGPSNYLLRDLICGKTTRPSMKAILQELCRDEAVPLSLAGFSNRPGSSMTVGKGSVVTKSATGTRAHRTGGASTTAAGSPARTPDTRTKPASTDASSSTTGTPLLPPVARAVPPPLPQQTPTAPPTPPPQATPQVSNPAAASYHPPYLPPHVSATSSVSMSFSGGASSSAMAPPSATGSAFDLPELVAQIVPGEPGTVWHPYLPGEKIQVAPGFWEGTRRLKCPDMDRFFRLPVHLPPLVAGLVQGVVGQATSPYAGDQVFRVPIDQWEPSGHVVCEFTGRPLILPAELPVPVVQLVSSQPGRVFSPYRAQTVVSIPGHLWKPGARVQCPETRRWMDLPQTLPPLEAAVDAAQPGKAESPYVVPAQSFDVAPLDWEPGRELTCPFTQRQLRLPAGLPEWKLVSGKVRADQIGHAESPYPPHAEVEVLPERWVAGGRIQCGTTGRFFYLPDELPLLEGGVTVPGKVISPFSGQERDVAPDDWIAGKKLTCGRTGKPFRLPEKLPDWTPVAEVLRHRPGWVRSPFGGRKEQQVPGDQWIPGKVIACAESGRNFRLPDSDLPLLEALVRPGVFGKVESPYRKGQECTIAPETWDPGAKIECPATHRQFILPGDLEPWVLEGELIPRRPGWVRSPYGHKREFQAPATSWHQGGVATCPETGRKVALPLPEGTPPVALERAAVERALGEPEQDEKAAVEAMATEFPGLTAAIIASVWKRHGLGTVVERRDAQQTAELVPGKPGWVRSPYGSNRQMQVSGALWEPGGSTKCEETGRRFLLPANLPPLEALIDEARPGGFVSPYDSTESWRELDPNEWESGKTLTCPVTHRKFLLPKSLPRWVPAARLDKDRLGWVISPFGKHAPMAVEGSQWKAGGEVQCRETGKAIRLPDELPPLLGLLLAGGVGRVTSPYAPKTEVKLAPDQWVPNASVTCPVTNRVFVLPGDLPEWLPEAELIKGKPGLVRSPFGDRHELKVSGDQWEPGARLLCPQTGRPFVLPGNLPPLNAVLLSGELGVVESPYRPGVRISVPVEQWVAGGEVRCPESERACVLPPDLPPWEADGLLVEGRPGWVASPYRPGVEISVPAGEWLPGKRLQCEATKRFFVLPANLPLLEGRVVPGKNGSVASPFAPDAEVQVSFSDWKPGAKVSCPVTRRIFALPALLPDTPWEAAVVRPGCVLSPYEEGTEVQVSGADWKPGHAIFSTVARRNFVLPRELPSLVAGLVGGKVGLALSPYAEGTEVQVPRGKWKPGAKVMCPVSHRTFVLPEELPEWPGKPLPVKPILWFGAAASLILLAAVAGPIVYQKAKEAYDKANEDPIVKLEREWTQSHDPKIGASYSQALFDQFNQTTLGGEEKRRLAARFIPIWKEIRSKSDPNGTLKDIIAVLDKTGDKLAADEELRLAKVDEATKELAWNMSVQRHEEQGLQLPILVDEYMDALTAGVSKAQEWLLARSSDQGFPLEHVVRGLEEAKADGLLDSILAKARGGSADLAKTAWMLTARREERESGKGAVSTRTAYLESARRGDDTAKAWLWANVTAEAVKGSGDQVKNPFDPNGATLKIAASDWQVNKQVSVGDPPLYFKMPSDGLGPKMALAPFVAPKPGETKGTVNTPYTEPPVAVEVAKESWFPGADVICPQTKQVFQLPSGDTFPLLEATINLTEVKAQSKPLLISPFTNLAVDIRWEDWKGGVRINDPSDDKKRPFRMPESVADPELKVVAMKTDKDGGIVTSPYTGKELPVAWTEWIKEEELKMPDPDLKEKGVMVSMIVPSMRPALMASFDQADPTNITMPGGRKIKLAEVEFKDGKVSDGEGHWFEMPEDPGLPATVVGPGVVKNPYTGQEVSLSMNSWKEKALEPWDKSGKWSYRLPDKLPEHPLAVKKSMPISGPGEGMSGSQSPGATSKIASNTPSKTDGSRVEATSDKPGSSSVSSQRPQQQGGSSNVVPEKMAHGFVTTRGQWFKYDSKSRTWRSNPLPKSADPDAFMRDTLRILQSDGKIPKGARGEWQSNNSIIISP